MCDVPFQNDEIVRTPQKLKHTAARLDRKSTAKTDTLEYITVSKIRAVILLSEL